MTHKRMLSALLAAAMAFGLLCHPAAAASPSEVTDVLDGGTIWTDAIKNEREETSVTVKLRYHDWGDDRTVTPQAEPAELTFLRLSHLPLGVTLTVGPDFAFDNLLAYSDPDGDGVYEERLIRSSWTGGEDDGYYEDEVVPLPEQGPLVGSDSVDYYNYYEWSQGKNALFSTGYPYGYRTLTTDYLVELFGPNTLIHICEETGAAGYWWLLTGHPRGEDLGDDSIENYRVAVADSGHLTSVWAKDIVGRAGDSGLIPFLVEYNHRYDLRGPVTRAEFAAIAVSLYEAMTGQIYQCTGESPFTDVDPDSDNYFWILAAYELKIVNGMTPATFEPDRLVSRQDAALMLARVYERLGGKIPSVSATSFADDAHIRSYARSAVAFLSANDILNGVGGNRFDPKGTATVEQALKIALEMLDKLG